MSVKTQAWARLYIERGFAPIPVPSGSKKPNRPGWQSERHTLEDIPRCWNNGRNVGLLTGKPSGWLVDVDLDVPEAVSVADRFLPPTRTSGHGDALDTHWWYYAEGTETKDFLDTDGKKKIVELRAGGRQTLVAPSVHPHGDEYVWNTAHEIETIEAMELRRDVNKLATSALIARHLPEHKKHGGGGRHDYALALAGFMLRNSRVDQKAVLNILLAAWDAKGWPSEQDRREAHGDLRGAVEDTVDKLEQGKKVKGGRKLEEMKPGLAIRIADYWGWSDRKQEGDDPNEKEERRNQADRLIGYALEDVQELFSDQHGAPHALVDGEPIPLTSRCYSWLRRLMWDREEKAVNGEYLKTAAGTLAARAEFSGEVRELHARAAWHDETLYYELRAGRVIKVDAKGWNFEANPPVLFRRYPNLKALPDPKAGGTLDVLDSLVNLKTERDHRLFKAYLVTLPLPQVGRPIFNASGVMGSGKTTIGRVVKRMWDPTAPETVRFDHRDFLQKASHAFAVMLDNQNTIPEWAADTLCRLVTGEADSKRRLYTDDEDVIIELRRPVILNGINVPTDRGDVLDRSLVVELERILDGERRTEEELWERFGAEHPKLLGAAFEVLAKAISCKRSLKLSRRPRLADWGEYAAAVYEVMGWGADIFLKDWDEVVKVQNQATLDGSPVAQAVIKFMEGKFMEDKQEYVAASSELHKKLGAVAEELGVNRDKEWPKSPRWLWKRIKEVLPLLLAAGIEAVRHEDKAGSRIALRRVSGPNATNATEDENREDKPKSGGVNKEPNATSNATNEASNATGGIKGGISEEPNATSKADGYADYSHGGISGIRNGEFSEDCTPATSATSGAFVEYAYVTTEAGVSEAIANLAKATLLGIDFETVGTNPRKGRLRLVQVSDGDKTYVVDCFAVDPRPLLEAMAEKTLVAHNALYELSWLKVLYDLEPAIVHDTMLMSQVLYAGEKETRTNKDGNEYETDVEHGLGSVAHRMLDISLDKDMQVSDWSSPELSTQQLEYAALDASVLVTLHQKLSERTGEEL